MDLSLENSRPHFRSTSNSSSSAAAITSNNNTTELFICFTSRTSSMKLTKSILSPARAARDGGASLSSSLSRRLRTNSSLKGGASPFFPTTKKRGCGFDNPEPSSPKVTCIGQVRVKTKKKVQRRSLSRRRSGGGGGGGEVSFRKIEQSENGSGSANHYQQQPECLPHHRNQRWVHLPVSICEALSSCLFPCKSSCFSTSNDNDNCGCGGGGGGGDRSCENGCGAVFARWLVSVNEGDNGKRREIELVVGGGEEIDNNNVVVEEEVEEEERVSMRRRSSRRHVFDDIEVKDDNRIEVKGQLLQRCEEEEVVESGRVSICVPPKNALLLMRCRSDPMKMADLASRFSWDAHAHASKDIGSGIVEEEEGIEEFVRECGGSKDEIFMVKEDEVTMSEVIEQEDVAVVVTNAVEENEIPEIHEEEELVTSTHCDEVEGRQELQSEIEVKLVEEEQPPQEQEEEEVESNMSSFEDLLNREAVADQHYEDCYPIQEKEQEQEQEEENSPICHLSPSITESQSESEDEIISDSGTTELVPLLSDEETTFHKQEQEEESTVISASNSGKPEQQQQEQELVIVENTEPPPPPLPLKKEKETPQLPDCLLLMMCEPKLSMEVSKETWVCTTDFVKWLPQRPPKQPPRPPATKTEPPVKRRLSTDSKPKLINDNAHKEHQPPRSSCSLPAAVLERKLVNAVAYEPFVLTRCKSEPMRTAAAKLMPVQPDHQSCVWKNAVRKMEPHRRATVGVGPA